MTESEKTQLALAWLQDFARQNDAVAEGKHAAAVLARVEALREALDAAEDALMQVEVDLAHGPQRCGYNEWSELVMQAIQRAREAAKAVLAG